MPNEDHVNETLLFDPQRVLALAERLAELKRADPNANVDTVLSELDSTSQSLYRDALVNYLSGNAPGDDDRLAATQLIDDFEAPGELRADATLDVAGPAVARRAADLPPASPPAKKSENSGRPPGKSTRKLLDKIGKFEIKSELGRGAFGVVYLAFDRELQRNVAIKLSLVSDKKIQERLRIEASKAAQIESEGIVPVYHIGNTETGATYIVQKYIQGSTLRDLLQEHGPMSPSRGVRLIRDIAVALEPAHLRDILHRDLKPDNILIDEAGKPWIADFGLAISEEEQQGRRGELAGTPAYMSPEQIKGRIDFLDPRSDIWSLGVMFYELLSGKLPFNGRDRKALAEQICELDPRPMHQRSPLLSEDVNAIFQRCCAKKPAERFASVRELAIALEYLIAGGLSDQNIRGSAAHGLFSDSTLQPSSTLGRSGSLGGGSTRSSHQDATQNDSARMGSTLQGSTHHQSHQRSSHDESMSTSHTSSLNTSTTGPLTSTLTSLASPKSWWLQTLGKLATLVLMVTLSVAVSWYFLNVGRVEVSLTPGPTPIEPEPTPIKPEPDPTPEIVPPEVPKLDVDGSPEKPWIVDASGRGSHTTIQSAIDAELPDSEIQQATIRVNPGSYNEQLRITRPVTIIGEEDLGLCDLKNADGPPVTIQCEDDAWVEIQGMQIDGQGHSSAIQFNAIDIESGSLKVASCTLRTTSQNCIKAGTNTTVAVSNCIFDESRDFAISTKDHKSVIVDNCRFRRSGVQLVGGPAEITSSTFLGREGIYADRTLPGIVTLTECEFNECASYGISATSNGIITATNCLFKKCELGAWSVFMDESDVGDEAPEVPGSVTVVDSEFVECTTAAKVDRGHLVLTNNCSIANGIDGIQVSGGLLKLENSSITDVANVGIGVLQDADVSLVNSPIDGTGLTGIMMNGGKLTVSGGSISNSTDVGVFLDEKCISATFNGVELSGNRQYSLWSVADNVKVTANDSKFLSSKFGIHLSAKEGMSQLGLVRCRFDAIADRAIYASGNVHVKFKDCDFGNIPESQQVGIFQSATVEKIVN